MKIISNGETMTLPPRGPAGPDGNPIGTVISYLGMTAPKDYLVCDGAAYPVSEYPELADFFQEQFGAVNYFGGDGTTNFAVPDMRNLFLRGYHGDAEERLSGEIGVRQEGTNHPYFYGSGGLWTPKSRGNYSPQNPDTLKNAATQAGVIDIPDVSLPSGYALHDGYTSRPVNMAVLYCVKAARNSPQSSTAVEMEPRTKIEEV